MIAELLDGVIQVYKLREKSVNEKIKKEIKKEEQAIKKEETDLEKEIKEDKKITKKKHLKKVKINDKGEVEKKTDGQRIMEAKKAKHIRLLQLQKLSLKGLILVLKVIKLIVQIIETFIRFLIMFLGVFGFLVVLFVVVLMIAIYGLLHLDNDILPPGGFFTPDDCIQGGQVIDGSTNSNLGSLSGAMTPYQQALYKTYTLYNEIFSKDPNEVFENPTNIVNLNTVLGKENVSRYLFGFSAVETGFKFNNDNKDVLQYPSKTQANSAGYAFLGLHHNNIFDGNYKYDGVNGSKVLKDSFVSEWKQKYVPSETPLYDNNFIPYGVATQIGVVANNYLNGKFSFVSNNISSILDAYGITANRDKVTAYCQLFAGAASYHSGGGTVDSNLLSLWVALWSATSTDDSNRSFNNIKITGASENDFSESSARPNILGKTSGSFTVDTSTTGLSYFSVNNKVVSEALWQWVALNCSNPEYFESTARIWLNENAGSTLILDAHYGVLAYLQANRVIETLGGDIPVASGGSMDECECVETTPGGGGNFVGNIDINSIKVGVPQGPWSSGVKDKLSKYNDNLKKSFGAVNSITNPDTQLTNLGMSVEEWRKQTKWGIPYFKQDYMNSSTGQYVSFIEGGNDALVAQGWISSLPTMGSGCHLYMHSYMVSCLTSSVITPVEFMCGLDALNSRYTGGINAFGNYINAYHDLGLKVVYNHGGISGDISDFESYFGLTSSELGSNESSTLQKVVDTVLSKNGIIGFAGGKPYYTNNTNHYVVIYDKTSEGYKVTGYNSGTYGGQKTDTYSWDYIYKGMSNHGAATSYNFQRILAYNPNLKVSNGVGGSNSGTDKLTVEIPSDLKQSGLIPDFTNYSYFYKKWNSDSNQRKVADLWYSKGKQSDKGVATLDGFYLVAAKDKFGVCGDAIQVNLEDGSSFSCILADVKGSDAQSPWGHVYETGVSLIEWEAVGSESDNVDGVNIKLGDWSEKKVVSITNLGSYLNGEVKRPSNNSNKPIEFKNFLFIGDSYTDGLNTQMNLSSLGHTAVAAVGAYPSQYLGSTSSSVTIGGSNYEKNVQLPNETFNGIIVLLGVNNLGQISEMQSFLNELKGKYSCPIFVQKVFPVGSSYSTISASEMNQKISDYNKSIKEFCDKDSRFNFIDTTTGLVTSDGYLEPTSDGLHLKDKSAYETWYSNIKNAVSSFGVSENGPFDNVECIESPNSNGGVGEFIETPGKFQGPWGDLTPYIEKISDSSLKTKSKNLIQYVGMKPKQEGTPNYEYTVDKWKNLNGKGVVRYSQWSSGEDWAQKNYGDSTFSSSACGAYSTACVISTMTGKYINTVEVALAANTYRIRHSGEYFSMVHADGESGGAFYHGDLAKIIEECGLKTETASQLSLTKVDDTLNQNGMVILVVNSSYSNRYTSGAHYVVIREKTANGYLIYSSTNWVTSNGDNYCNTENTAQELETLNSGKGQIIYVTK